MIQVKRNNGKVTRLVHAEYLPAFYFISKEILDKCGYEINQIPRVPREIATSKKAIKLIESDLFWQVISDAYAYMAWPFMMPKTKREIYSGNEPSWVIAHAADLWVNELTKLGILPIAQYFWSNLPNEYFGYVPIEEISGHLAYIVPRAVERLNLQPVFDIVKEYRCHEDFDWRYSRQKVDFYRKWYHSRWKYKQISYEAYKKCLAQDRDNYWDTPDYTAEYEDKVIADIKVNEFKKLLSQKDLEILSYRTQGKTYEDIAKIMGYSNHSGILKRVKKLQKLWEDFEEKYNLLK